MILTHKFVTNIPKSLEEGIIYVSMEYSTVIHSCCCGCGEEVVTPLSPTDWKLIYNGQSISLSPSIGNWNIPCESHYWITNNKVEWASKWSEDKINQQKDIEYQEKVIYYNKKGDKDKKTKFKISSVFKSLMNFVRKNKGK